VNDDTMFEERTELELRSDSAEKAIIGAVSFYPDELAGVLASLDAADFYNPHRSAVWSACQHLSTQRQWIDPVSVSKRLAEVGSWNEATRVVVSVDMATSASAMFAKQYADTISEFARRRDILRTINRARSIVTDRPGAASEILASVRATLEPLDQNEAEAGGTKTWGQMWEEFREMQTGDKRPGIPTPWEDVDAFLGGLHGGRLYVIGGSPGDGKSSVALNIGLHAALHGHEVLAYSAEMPTTEVFGRLVARGSDVDLGSINRAELSEDQLDRIATYVATAGDLPLRVNADDTSLAMITSQARAHHHRRGLDILIVDYLQLINGDKPGRSQEEEIARISTALKRLARELECVVIVPAQLNRNPTARPDKKPTKSDLRGSGKIEQDADVVILLWRAPDPEGQPSNYEVTFLIDKNRQGPKGEITLAWHGAYGAVESLSLTRGGHQ
jgi:replicative DNA helicase